MTVPKNPCFVATCLRDLQIHRETWRAALVEAMERSDASPDNYDLRSFWPAEIAAFDRVFDALSNFEVVIIDGPSTGVRV